MTDFDRGLTPEQYDALLKPIRPHRIKTRRQGGKDLSYVEAWDIKAHLTRVFGFGNWDFVVTDARLLYQRDVEIGGKDNKRAGWEVAFQVLGTLRVRDQHGNQLAEHAEAAVGYFSAATDLGSLYDNAIKAGASDALKRCALAFGSPFGLSLYDDGSRREVIQQTIVHPDGWEPDKASEEQERVLKDTLGATEVKE